MMETDKHFALVSTVDSMGMDFPIGVFLFESEREAVLFAANVILQFEHKARYSADECNWIYGDDHFENPDDFLEAWQNELDLTEYFHVQPVLSTERWTNGND